ncbi:hypothetical protein EDD16DRAFT_1715232 [Pisolithus croceorrhizus]|nr:hypothetical protein EDD16DRAFT_1715232 [Pisolithus croceorrhizus]
MERTIGNLGQEIHQPSDPFSNLAQQGIQHCQVNALKAMLPHLDPPKNTNLHASANLGKGYILLAMHDWYLTTIQGAEARVIAEYLSLPYAPKICCWAHLHLPNGQIAQSQFQELQKAPEDIHMAHNVKVSLNGGDWIVEVQYFARLVVMAAENLPVPDEDLDTPECCHFTDVALITLYSQPDVDLLKKSYGVLASCTKPGEASLRVIKISDIRSVVAMILHRPIIHGVAKERYFLVEKTGMEIACFGLEDDKE